MKLKKIITMGLAAVMTVSAMSISAFAADSIPQGAVMSVTAPDGNGKIYLTREDVKNGKTSLKGYGGVVFTYIEDIAAEAAMAAAENNDLITSGDASVNAISASTLYFNSTNVPGLVSPINCYNSSASGNFTTPSSSQRFSDNAIYHGTNTSAVMTVKPTTSITYGDAYISLAAMNSSGVPIGVEGTVYPSGTGTSGIVASGMSSGTYLYIYINNSMSSTIKGKITLSCAN